MQIQATELLFDEPEKTAIQAQSTKFEQWTFSRDGFTIQENDRPFCVEIFGGSGRLTKALRAEGFDAWSADWKGSKLTLESPACL